VITRAGLPESALREVFQSDEDCYLAAFEQGLRRLSSVVAEAAAHEQRWLARVRAGLVALLGFLDDEPQWGRLLLTEAPARFELECGRRAQGVLGELLEEGRGMELTGAEPTDAEPTPAPQLMAELVLGGVFSVIRERMLDPDGGLLVELAPSLMPFIVTPYLGEPGESAASPELAGSELAGRPATGGDALSPADRSHAVELPIRATHRTMRVLGAIESVPRSSNREIAEAAGLTDEGQTSRLLGRLEQRGLIENVGLGPSRGEPNAWLLTPYGQRVVKAIGHGFAVGAAGRGRRVRGSA